MNYLDILNDKVILHEFEQIDKHNNNQFNHGLQHAKNVIDNMIKLTTILEIKEPELTYLLIACVLHDIGQLGGSENHCIRSKDFASDYLKNKVDIEWFNKVISAIEQHHEKENINNLTLFEHLVLFADKMDFTNMRLDKNYINENKDNYFENHILNIDFEIKQNIFRVVVTTDKSISENDFCNWAYYLKIVKRIEEFANKLNINYEIDII